LEKLRKFFTKRGIVSTTAILAGAISANSVQAAPVGLAVKISLAVKGTAVTASITAIVKGTLKLMTYAKFKLAAGVAVAVLLATGTITMLVAQTSSSPVDDSLWENLSTQTFERAPAIVMIRPSHFTNNSGSITVNNMKGNLKTIGRMVSFGEIIQNAYESPPSARFPLTRIVLPPDLPQGNFDYLVTVTNQPRPAFQAEIKKQFGMTARREVRETDVLLLKLKFENAPGLKISAPNANLKYQMGPRAYVVANSPVSRLGNFLETYVSKQPVLDYTGLTNNYDIALNLVPKRGETKKDAVKKVLLDQLGLELVPTNMPIEMLVVEKVK
jgi:uncharacterized protein (TIGR03435 family)